MPTITKTEYGQYEHGQPYRDGQSYFRRDRYTTAHKDMADMNGNLDRLFAASIEDDSPIHPIGTGYNPKCSCCWLGFAHTANKHKANTNTGG